MPHLVIEYSQNLEQSEDIHLLMESVYKAAVSSAVMQAKDIKIRAIPYSYFKLADSGDSFIHVTCHLLAGRTPEQKVKLANSLRLSLAEKFSKVHSISIDIVNMDPDAYKKRLLTII